MEEDKKKQKDKKIRCMYCNRPITVYNFVAVCKNGFLCNSSVCLVQEKKLEVKNKMKEVKNEE